MTTHEPILKLDWERHKEHVNVDIHQAQELIKPFTSDTITRLSMLSEGCANTNIKVEFLQRAPLVMRLYLREYESLAREVALHKLLANTLPIPELYYHDPSCELINHPYAILEFVAGELMRNVILTGDNKDIANCAFSAGVNLSHLRHIQFTHGGFFQTGLEIRPFSAEEEYLPFAQACLKKDNVQASLGLDLRTQLVNLINTNQTYLPDKDKANLTHADFDPANILVKRIDGQYRVSAILDWEFAFSGTYLLDIGMFLRYSHKLPKQYEQNFIAGIMYEGDTLPEDWKKSAKLMDIICLLSLLYWNPIDKRPKLNKDVVSLLQYTVDYWQEF